jgi:uncharacterized protein YutE (UPF0331/DUF86 family)
MTPGRADAAVVRRHLAALDEALQGLRPHQQCSIEQLRTNRDLRWVVERGLHLAAQNVLDISTHVAASLGHDVADYAAAVDRLGDAEILPRAFAQRFRSVAGFRNVVVHGYLEIDLNVLHRILQTGLDDFVEFAEHVSRHLDTLP